MPPSSSTAGELAAPGPTKAPRSTSAPNFGKMRVEFDPDEFSQTGDIAGFGEQVFPIRGSISTKEIFGEARIPLVTDKLVRRLAFEGGFRKSWYENSRSKFSSDAYKLALDLTAVSGLRFRASQQGANRAPNVLELFAPAQPDSFARDPCAGTSPRGLGDAVRPDRGHAGAIWTCRRSQRQPASATMRSSAATQTCSPKPRPRAQSAWSSSPASCAASTLRSTGGTSS